MTDGSRPEEAKPPEGGGSKSSDNDPSAGRQPDGRSSSGSSGKSGGGRRRRGGRGRGGSGRGGESGGDADSTPDAAAPVTMAASAIEANKPKIGDSRPAPGSTAGKDGGRRRGGDQRSADGDGAPSDGGGEGGQKRRRRRRGGRGRGRGGQGKTQPVQAVTADTPVELDEETLARRRGRERKGKPVGRYMMAVSVKPEATQISVLEGRNLIEHYVSLPADDISQIHGNIYIGRVQNVLPGMEAAFIDITTPKNAVLYRSDVAYDEDDLDKSNGRPRIEHVLKGRQLIMCQVTKNPIGHKGARLTQEVSLPGRFVVLVPNSTTYGISKRLPDKERKRLRSILDRVKPSQHGVIVRTAAENVTTAEIEKDVQRLVSQWDQIEALAKNSKGPTLLYREPDMAVRIIREEFNKDYRSVVIDDRALFEDVQAYVSSITPALADRIEYYEPSGDELTLFERFHVHDQLVKALDRKVWLPSGGSLIIEQTEALTVIDVNTGKNVGRSSLEETVYRNNLEAAKEIAKQLRLRDIGGIIVIDFVDMESRKNREETIKVFRDALARDKTRTQAFDISELGLVEMTRKRIGEGLIESLSKRCETCDARGLIIDDHLLEHL